jgi:hypothetical protein
VRGEPRQAVRPPEVPDIRRSAVMRKVPMAVRGYVARVSASTVLAVAGIRTWNGHIQAAEDVDGAELIGCVDDLKVAAPGSDATADGPDLGGARPKAAKSNTRRFDAERRLSRLRASWQTQMRGTSKVQA